MLFSYELYANNDDNAIFYAEENLKKKITYREGPGKV